MLKSLKRIQRVAQRSVRRSPLNLRYRITIHRAGCEHRGPKMQIHVTDGGCREELHPVFNCQMILWVENTHVGRQGKCEQHEKPPHVHHCYSHSWNLEAEVDITNTFRTRVSFLLIAISKALLNNFGYCLCIYVGTREVLIVNDNIFLR